MLEKEPIAYVNGEWVPKSQAKISVWDHGFLYGDGVFEGIRMYNGIIFRLDDHLNRLYASAKMLRIDVPLSREEMVKLIVETIKRNGFKSCYIRPIVTRGMGDLGLDPRRCGKPSVIIIAEPMEPLLGKRARETGITAIISSVRRDLVSATTHEIKSLNYLNSILAKLEAINAGADEAIILDQRGFVSEATAENIFIAREGKVLTPPPTAGILHGVTRKVVIRILERIGFKVKERDFTPFEMVTSDEVFLTGTGVEIAPVVKINGITIGDGKPGRITKMVIEEFQKVIRDPNEGYVVDYSS